jgi:hypothetical protein
MGSFKMTSRHLVHQDDFQICLLTMEPKVVMTGVAGRAKDICRDPAVFWPDVGDLRSEILMVTQRTYETPSDTERGLLVIDSPGKMRDGKYNVLLKMIRSRDMSGEVTNGELQTYCLSALRYHDRPRLRPPPHPSRIIIHILSHPLRACPAF